MNRDFLKEVIADAKTVKELAIANAKIALEEAFSPKLQAMFAQKLEEMDQEEMDEEFKKSNGASPDDQMDEISLEELLAELEGLECRIKIRSTA